ncbi:hypothetical protein CPT_Silvanus_026 [Stenotrophomonas phage Silvanus]|nr:hypothetical protein CPT_Silvanus_026 [Stenotrophomonas phage Silvanus]
MPLPDLTGDELAVVVRCLSIEGQRQRQLADLEATKRNCDHDTVRFHLKERARIESVKEKIINATSPVAGTPGATVANTTKTHRRYSAAAGDQKVR